MIFLFSDDLFVNLGIGGVLPELKADGEIRRCAAEYIEVIGILRIGGANIPEQDPRLRVEGVTFAGLPSMSRACQPW